MPKCNEIRQVLYGIPLPPSQISRLAHLSRKLGPGTISVLVDDINQLEATKTFQQISGVPLQIFIKVDTGYHRAGLPTGTAGFRSLIDAVFEAESNKTATLIGFYSHAGHSYGSDTSTQAKKLLIEEIEGLELATIEIDSMRVSDHGGRQYILSVGATPTATSIESAEGSPRTAVDVKLESLIGRVKKSHCIELHAGVYPFLDLQQLATHVSPSAVPHSHSAISLADVALSILVEIASVYESRAEPEVLVAAGTLALGREPCKSYNGWGVVSDWGTNMSHSLGKGGWKIGRISQEHSVLTHDSDGEISGYAALSVGQKIRIWPNHACVASAGFSWYLVIDSSLSEGRQDEIVDVWVRCREW